MIATWMIYASALGVLFGLAALALEHGPRPKRSTTRWIWIGAIVATVIVPGAFALRPAGAPRGAGVRNDAGAHDVATPAANSATAAGAQSVMPSARPRPDRPALSMPAVSYTPPDTPVLDRVLLIAWLLASFAVAIRWVRSLLALRRERHAWRVAEVAGTRVWVSRDVGPALFGVIRPRVVLPEWALQLDPRSLSLMLAHEAEHQRARDPVVLGATAVLGVFAPWNVALWWQFARLRLAIEVDCDARVLKGRGDAREYASLLVAVGERMSSFTRIAPAFVEHRSLLERRIVAMSDAKRPRRAAQVALALCAAVACVAIACGAPSPARSAGVGRMPASMLGAGAAQQQWYPRILPVDTLDASSMAWIRASVGRYYPAILAGDTTFVFVSLFVDDRGALVNAAARHRPGDLRPGEKISTPAFLFVQDSAFRYGGDEANRASAVAAAERKVLNDDAANLMSKIEGRVALAGVRTVFPQTFEYDSTRGAGFFDPFLGTDPRAFQSDEDIRLAPGLIGPNLIEIHILMFKPGRGTKSDFGHPVRMRALSRIMPIAPKDTAAYSMLGNDVVAAVAHCHQPACNPVIWSGPGAGEVMVQLDSASSPGASMQWHREADGTRPVPADWKSRGAISQDIWDTLSHKPLVLMDGVRRPFKQVLAAGSDIQDFKWLSPADAMKLSRDPAAANGAIVVTTKGHPPR